MDEFELHKIRDVLFIAGPQWGQRSVDDILRALDVAGYTIVQKDRPVGFGGVQPDGADRWKDRKSAFANADYLDQILKNQRTIMEALVYIRTGFDPAIVRRVDRERPINEAYARLDEINRFFVTRDETDPPTPPEGR